MSGSKLTGFGPTSSTSTCATSNPTSSVSTCPTSSTGSCQSANADAGPTLLTSGAGRAAKVLSKLDPGYVPLDTAISDKASVSDAALKIDPDSFRGSKRVLII